MADRGGGGGGSAARLPQAGGVFDRGSAVSSSSSSPAWNNERYDDDNNALAYALAKARRDKREDEALRALMATVASLTGRTTTADFVEYAADDGDDDDDDEDNEDIVDVVEIVDSPASENDKTQQQQGSDDTVIKVDTNVIGGGIRSRPRRAVIRRRPVSRAKRIRRTRLSTQPNDVFRGAMDAAYTLLQTPVPQRELYMNGNLRPSFAAVMAANMTVTDILNPRHGYRAASLLRTAQLKLFASIQVMHRHLRQHEAMRF